MRRCVIIGPLFLVTLLLGLWIYFNSAAGSQDSAGHFFTSQLWFRLSGFITAFSNDGPLWFKYRDPLLFGGLALFGTIMTGLAIRRATKSSPKESKIQSLVRNLTQEKEEAEKLVKLKSEFLNQVSHELRTPLAVIVGYLDCMVDGLYGQIDPKHTEILQVLSKQSNDLNNMINHILVFSRLEAGKSPVQIENFPISKIMGDLKDTYDFLGRRKAIETIWDLAEEIPDLESDPGKLKEILNNLLQNALKFTDQGSVSTRTRYIPDQDAIALQVADTGAGIPHDSLASIFDPFVQVSEVSPKNPRGGIGLGLSIVKKHVDQLKGTINVKSEVGKGTTFSIIIPRIYKTDHGRRQKLFPLRSFFRKRVTSVGSAARSGFHPCDTKARGLTTPDRT